LQTIAGHDSRDSTSAEMAIPDYVKTLSRLPGRPRIGIAREFFSPSLEEGVRKVIMEAIDSFREMGFDMVEVTLPNIAYALPAYYIIAPAEASSNLARYDGARYGATPGPPILSQCSKNRDEKALEAKSSEGSCSAPTP